MDRTPRDSAVSRVPAQSGLPPGGRAGPAGVFWLWPTGTLAVIVGAYASVLAELGRDWVRDPNYSHGFLIPVISAYLIWKGRSTVKKIDIAPSNLGLLGILGALALLIFGAAGAEVFTQRVSFVGLVFSSVVFLLGWSWARPLLFPIGFLLLAIPLPYIIYYSLTAPMQAIAAKTAVVGLKGLGVPVLAQGNVLHLPNEISLEVAEACSGIRSLYAFLALGALMAYGMNIPGWARALVFLATIPLSVLGNAVRVLFTSVGAFLVGPWVTEGLVHELFGVITFVASLGLFLILRTGVRRLWLSAP